MFRRHGAFLFFSIAAFCCLIALTVAASGVYYLHLKAQSKHVNDSRFAQYNDWRPPLSDAQLRRINELPEQFWMNEDGEICVNDDGEPILCEDSPCNAGECTYCDPAAYQFEVTLSGIGAGDNEDVNCDSCSELNGTFTLTNTTDCRWEYTAGTSCGVVGPPVVSYDGFKIELTKTEFQTTLIVYINRTTTPTGYATLATYTETSAWDCQSPLTLDDSAAAGTSICQGFPLSVTVTPL